MWFNVVAGFCLLFLLKYLWSRRKLYYLSWTLDGPFAWPIIGNSLYFLDSSKTIKTIKDIASKYQYRASIGRFWLGPQMIIYCDGPEEAEIILTSPHTTDKGYAYGHVKRMMGGDGLITIGGEPFKIHRKLLKPTVQNYNILNSFYPKFNKNMNILIDLLADKVGKGQFDIYQNLEACSLDMVCESTFGVTMNVQGGENRSFLDCVNYLSFVVGILILQPWYRLYPIFRLSKYYSLSEKSRSEARLFAQKIVDRKIKEFKDSNKEHENNNECNEFDEFGKRRYNIFIDECVRLLMQQGCFSEEDVVTESYTMMVGGFETTALTVSYIVLMLALHPEYQEKVFQEIREIFPDQRSNVTAEDITKFDYTDRFIKETMRLTPVLPIISRMSSKDIKIGKHTIPAGVELMISIFNMHRRANIWGEKAEVFDPDHFLPENVKKRHPYSYIPFSAGIRNCIGLKYAHIVVRLFVAWMVRNYRFTTDLKMEELDFRMNVTMKLVQKHMVHIHKRENY